MTARLVRARLGVLRTDEARLITINRNALPLLALLASAPLPGCCFGAFAEGMQEGFTIGMECEPLIQAVNSANATVNAIPEAPADAEQAVVDAEFTQLATAYDQGVATLSAVPLSQPALTAERDELVSFYRDAATSMRAMPALMATAIATGDRTQLDVQVAQMQSLDTREQEIVNRINATCNR